VRFGKGGEVRPLLQEADDGRAAGIAQGVHDVRCRLRGIWVCWMVTRVIIGGLWWGARVGDGENRDWRLGTGCNGC
jgi:hypothetical protein